MKFFKCLFGAALVGIVAVSFYADFRNPFSGREMPGFDGRLRLNEAEVLRMGINPFDILSGRIYPPKGYIAGNHAVNKTWDVPPEGNKEVHTYTPWSYSLVLPFTFLPRPVTGWIFWTIDTLALAGILAFAFFTGYGVRRRWTDGVFVALAAVCLGNPFPVNSDLNNYSTVLVLAAFAMCVCLNRRKDVLAGFCWALLMVKPHFGILFAIPILLEKRWTTCFVAVTTCVLLSIPPAVMCRTYPWEMVLNVVDQKGAGFCFQWTGFFPAQVFAVLAKSCGPQGVRALSAALGVALLGLMMWKIRRDGIRADAFGGFYLLCIPVALTIPMWSYSQFQDASILCFVQIALACALIRTPSPRTKAFFAMAILLNASRVFISFRHFAGASAPQLTMACHLIKGIAYAACLIIVFKSRLLVAGGEEETR